MRSETRRSRQPLGGARWGFALLLLLLLALPTVLPSAAHGQSGDLTPGSALTPADIQSYRWRELGPAVTSGRITAFAVRPDDANTIYVASASGGAWKTVNGGTTWRPVFHSERSVSLGAITLDPSDPEVVWVGTGEQNSVRSSSFGDGIYRSTDGGESWQHMGLRESRHIGRILVHPDNSDVVFVAAMGSLWGPNPERGLYKTTDGGESWTKILGPSEYTGVVDVVMDPRRPDVLFAATFQRERRQWSMLGGGPESGLFRSDDGGESWAKVESGFATGDLGRIGITYCSGSPNVLYSSAVGPDGGIFRSTDAGATWERRNRSIQSHWFYGELVCDPEDPDRLYVPMTPLYVSEDGGATFRNLVRTAVHVDHHTLWVNPKDPRHLMVGNDGGVYISRDRGESWLWQSNLPVMQLYTVAVDMQEPFYHVYGGTQDNGSWGGPTGTRYGEGVSLEDWTYTAGGDGFFSQVDPTDSDIIYAESQYGVLYRIDRKTGERRLIQPWQPQDGGAPSYRWNWSAPLVISPHDPATLYFAANVVFRTRDRGDSWEVISSDLTRQISRDSLPLQGRIQPPDAVDLHASTALYGNASALAVSSMRPGLIAVGTDDGLVQVTLNDGSSWYEADSFPGVPEMMKVGGVAWSSSSEETLFVVFDGHKDNIFGPFVVRSDDFGRTWENVTGDLPDFGPTRSVAVHPRNGELIFVGTEFGAFASSVGGERWIRLGEGLPTVAVHGIVVHPRENDLVIGTHGRGFWVLDDIGLMASFTHGVKRTGVVFPTPRPATQIRDVNRGRGSVGDSYWTAENPPRGAILDYWIGERMVGSAVRMEVLDASGQVMRTLVEGTAEAGGHRAVWDLRHEAPLGPDGRPSPRGRGRFVLPGTYQVRLQVGDLTRSRSLLVRMDPALSMEESAREALDRTLALQADLVGAAAVLGSVADTLAAQAQLALEAVSKQPDSPPETAERARSLVSAAQRLRVVLSGPGGGGIAQQETVLPLGPLVGRLYSTTEAWTGPPTEDQLRLTRRAHGEIAGLAGELQTLIEEQMSGLRQAFEDEGIPWPAGEAPALPDNLIPPYGS